MTAIGDEVARIRAAKESLAAKMESAGYALTGSETLSELVELLDASRWNLPALDALTFGAEGQETFEGITDGANYQDIARAVSMRWQAGKPLPETEFTVTAPPGESVAAIIAGEACQGVEEESGQYTISFPSARSATYLPCQMKRAILSIPNVTGVPVVVIAPSGATVTATQGENVYYGIESEETPGEFTIAIPDYGSYVIGSFSRGYTYAETVVVSPVNVDLSRYSLPEGYKAVEWLESDGTNSISAGVIADVWRAFEGEVAFTLDNSAHIGYRGGTGTYCGYDKDSNTITCVCYGRAPVYGNPASIPADSDFHYFYGCDGYQRIDDVEGNQDPYSNNEQGYHIMFVGPQKIRWFKIYAMYSNTQPDRYYVPVITDTSQGMYDLVNNVFYEAKAEDGFTAGPEVS